MLKVFIDENGIYYHSLKYVFSIFCFNKQIQFVLVENKNTADLVFDETESEKSIIVDIEFYHELFINKNILNYSGINPKDLLTKCFYLINSLGEYNSANLDTIGRFKFENSFQQKEGKILENTVQLLFNKLQSEHPVLSKLKHQSRKSQIFISHDMDNVNTAWLEDGFAALKKGNIPKMMSLMLNQLLQRPDWLNIDKILKIHTDHHLKSTFFWIVNKGKTENNLVNADYNFQSKKIQEQVQAINKSGFENGLHKSVSDESYESEIEKLSFIPAANRNHYLKFNLPLHYKNIERSKIKVDCSLGFAEHYGFRNNYGQPFQPFDIENNKVFSFVETPLHLMDRTFYSYMKIPVKDVSQKCIDFIEKNKEDCTISLLWHNNFFNSVKYDGYLEEYKKILSYLYESKHSSITTKEIYEIYKLV